MKVRYLGAFFMLYWSNAVGMNLQRDLDQLKSKLTQLNNALSSLIQSREDEIQALNKEITQFAQRVRSTKFNGINNEEIFVIVGKITRYKLLTDLEIQDEPDFWQELQTRAGSDEAQQQDYRKRFFKTILDEYTRWIEGNNFSKFAWPALLGRIEMIRDYRELSDAPTAYQDVRRALIDAINPNELRDEIKKNYESVKANPRLLDNFGNTYLDRINIYREITRDQTEFQDFENFIKTSLLKKYLDTIEPQIYQEDWWTKYRSAAILSKINEYRLLVKDKTAYQNIMDALLEPEKEEPSDEEEEEEELE